MPRFWSMFGKIRSNIFFADIVQLQIFVGMHDLIIMYYIAFYLGY